MKPPHGIFALGLLAGVLATGPAPVQAQQQPQYSSNERVVEIQCKDNTNWAALLGIYGAWGGSHGNPNAQTLGSIASRLGQMEHEKQVAREGKNQVNVYQGQTQAPQITIYNFSKECSSLTDFPFAANYYEDFSRNNKVELNEFIGVKDKFRDDENVNLIFYNSTKKGDLLLDIYDSHGKKVYGTSMTTRKRGVHFQSLNNWLNLVRANNAHGIYTAVWYSKDLTAKNNFEIVPSQEQPSVKASRKTQPFVSYLWTDSNEDTFTQFPDEFPENGRKEFYITERIVFGLNEPESEGIQRKIRWEIYNPQGKMTLSNSFTTNKGGATLIGQEGDYSLTLWLVQNGGYNREHTIKWFVDDSYVGSSSVRILPVHKE